MLTALTAALILVSFISWGSLIWLIIALFRKKSVRRPLGLFLASSILAGVLWIILVFKALEDMFP